MCDLLWKCCKIIVDITIFFFLLFHRFRNFFSPIFDNAIATIAKKKFYTPISAMALPQFVCQIFFFFLFTSGTPRMGSKTGQRKFSITVAEIQHFLSPPFSSSLSYFWLNFGNGNTEIQSLSSKSQIILNSTYNAN